MNNDFLIPIERIYLLILIIRNERVILDTDLATLYGVTTKRLNEQVKRNRKRFSEDFMFQLSLVEKNEVVANCDHLKKLKFSRTLPNAFTEHGAIMAANILSSDRAIEASVQVVRAFVQLRKLLTTHKEIATEFAKVESHLTRHDQKIRLIFEAMHELTIPPRSSTRPIGFRSKSLKK